MKGTGSVEGSKFLDQSGSIPDAGTLTVGSLFSGIGGFELGFEATGRFKTRWQVECDPYATKVLEKHWPNVQRHDDVCTWPNETTEPVDVVIGGFPCQDISYAGKGAGLDGERSGLFYELMRIVRVVGPKYVVLENVAALFTRGMDQVLGTLASHGYDAEWEVVSAASVGAPHRRDRVFIIGCLADPVSTRAGDQNGTTGRQKRKSANAFKPATLRQGDWETLPEGTDASSADCGTLADSDYKQCKGCEQKALRGKSRVSRKSRRSSENQRNQWAVEPSVGRVANGVPKRMDRLRCLGNAIVPQVAQVVAERLLEIHDQNH
jgi:DNA (cytosine-5)-methyltransferase 1